MRGISSTRRSLKHTTLQYHNLNRSMWIGFLVHGNLELTEIRSYPMPEVL